MSTTCARSYEWLAELAFTSDRKRMSVVVRDADNVLWLYSKGADNVMLPRLAPDQPILDDTVAHCERFAATGLRFANLPRRVIDTFFVLFLLRLIDCF
jgi:phospholipid-translocating ATPase